jgi:hypothetical protein
MQSMVPAILLVSLFAGTGCTTTSGAPATTPASVAPPTTAAPGTVVATTTTTLAATTTAPDRLTEIAAIFEDLERRRLQAIFDQDEEVFRAVYANAAYLEESLVALRLLEVLDPQADFRQIPVALVADSPECIAVALTRDYAGILRTGDETTSVYVAEKTPDGWGLTWVGEGWACVGPHPLS